MIQRSQTGGRHLNLAHRRVGRYGTEPARGRAAHRCGNHMQKLFVQGFLPQRPSSSREAEFGRRAVVRVRRVCQESATSLVIECVPGRAELPCRSAPCSPRELTPQKDGGENDRKTHLVPARSVMASRAKKGHHHGPGKTPRESADAVFL